MSKYKFELVFNKNIFPLFRKDTWLDGGSRTYKVLFLEFCFWIKHD